jgi:hypothetical protein
MTIKNSAILARIAEREKIQAKSRELQQRAARLQLLVDARGEAEREVQAVAAADAAAMSAWCAAGCEGDAPSPDTKARDAAQKKLVAAGARAAAAESSLRELQQEALRLSSELEGVNEGVKMAVATHLTELHETQQAELRQLDDRRAVLTGVSAATWNEAQRRHAGIAGQAAADADAARVAWIGRRDADIDAAFRAAWAEIAATIPAQ